MLAGDGLLWQDGETFAVGAGDCIVHRPGSARTRCAAAPTGSTCSPTAARREAGLAHLPRAGVSWASPSLGGRAGRRSTRGRRRPRPARRSARRPRPSDRRTSCAWRTPRAPSAARSATSAGAPARRRTGLNHVTLARAPRARPPHCHSAEEELFVVLEGDGELALHPRGGGEPERQPLTAGDVLARPAGTGVAHALRAGAGRPRVPRLRHARAERHGLLPGRGRRRAPRPRRAAARRSGLTSSILMHGS